MPTTTWQGGAAAVAQVQTETLAGTWAATDTLTATINNKAITVTAADTDITLVVAAMVAAWNASTVPEHAEITAVDADPDIVFTHDTAGVPFTLTVAVAQVAGTPTVTPAATTAADGPNFYSTDANWSGNDIPESGDDVVIEDSAVDILYGLDQSAITGITSFKVNQSYTGKIGLPRTNANGYAEYRGQYLQIDPGTLTIGDGEGAGSGRIKIDHGTEAQVIDVLGSGARAEAGIPSVILKGVDAANTLTILRGDVGSAIFGGEASQYATLTMGYTTSQDTDAKLLTGKGFVVATINKSGGRLDIDTSAGADTTTLIQSAGQTTLRATSGVGTTVQVDGGIVYDMGGTNTIGTLTIAAGAEYNHNKSHTARTITNLTMVAGATFTDSFGVTIQTNGFDLYRTSLGDVTITRPPHRTWKESAID